MKVIVLGAGASKAYSQSPTKVKMPVAKDFFSTYKKLSIAENTWVLVGFFINYIRDKYGIQPEDFGRFDKDIEYIHSEVAEDLMRSLERYDKFNVGNEMNMQLFFRAYTQLIFLFTSVLNEIQNGPVSVQHLKLASQLKKDDVIVTFNWDTLMDRALNEITPWDCFSGYFVKPNGVYRDEWKISESSGEPDFPLLLKLHGSTNWLTSAPVIIEGQMKNIQEIGPEQFYVYESAKKPYPTYDGRFMEGYVDFSYGYYPVNLPLVGEKLPDGFLLTRSILRTGYNPKGPSEDKGLTSIPLIIPPVRNKAYDAFGTLFSDIWKKAEESITHADDIILIGYSFPETDIRSDQLFKRAFVKRSNLPKITIVNPFPERIEERFVCSFGIPKSNIRVIQDYFTEDFDLDYLFL